MAVLNAKQKKRSATIVVNGKGKFPMPDKAHARNALSRLNQARPQLTPAQKLSTGWSRRAKTGLRQGCDLFGAIFRGADPGVGATARF